MKEIQKEKFEKTIVFNGSEYALTFYDDFEGLELDDTKWSYGPESVRHDGNVWRNDMVKLDGNSNLVLLCDKLEGTVYKSGAIRSQSKFDQTYGYFEARCKLQSSPGFWGAFWLMPYQIDKGIPGGSDGTEIDIFESAYYGKDRLSQAIHFDGYGENHKVMGSGDIYVPGVYEGYHIFALEWTEDYYRFYVDGKQTYEIASKEVDICRVPTYLKLTVEAGNWAGKCDDSKLPDGILVDYVKAYKKV